MIITIKQKERDLTIANYQSIKKVSARYSYGQSFITLVVFFTIKNIVSEYILNTGMILLWHTSISKQD